DRAGNLHPGQIIQEYGVRFDLYALTENVHGLSELRRRLFQLSCLKFSQSEPVACQSSELSVLHLPWELLNKSIVNADCLAVHFLAFRHVAIQFVNHGNDSIDPCQTFPSAIVAALVRGELVQELNRLFPEPAPQWIDIRIL